MTLSATRLLLVRSPAQVDAHQIRGEVAETLGAFAQRFFSELDPDTRVAQPAEQDVALLSVMQVVRPTSLAVFRARARKLREADASRATDVDATLMHARDEWLRAVRRTAREAMWRKATHALTQHAGRMALERTLSGVRRLDLVGVWDLTVEELAFVQSLEGALASSPSARALRVVLPAVAHPALDSPVEDAFGSVVNFWEGGMLETTHDLDWLGPAERFFPLRDAKISRERVNGVEAQADRVCVHVAAALRDGVSPSAIAIVAPRFDDDALFALGRAMLERDLPFADPRGSLLRERPVVQLTLELLRCVSGGLGFSLARLRRALRLRLLPKGTHPEALRVMVRQASLAAASVREVIASLDEERARALPPWCSELLYAEELLAGVRSRAEACAALRDIIVRLGLVAEAERGALTLFRSDRPRTPLEQAELEGFSEDARAMRALVAAVERYHAMLVAQPVESPIAREGAPASRRPALDVIDAVSVLLPSHLPWPRARAAGALVPRTLREVAGLTFERVLLLDCYEPYFRTDVDPDANDTAARAARLRTAAERASLAWLVGSGAKVVAISPARHPQAWGNLDEAGLAPPLRALGDAPAWQPPMQHIWPLRMNAAALETRVMRETSRLRFFTHGAAAPEVDAVVLRDALRKPLPVTQLEGYVACAYRGFARHILRPRREPEAGHFLTPIAEGDLLHEALAGIFRELREDLRARPRHRERLLARARDWFRRRYPEPGGPSLRAARRHLEDNVLLLVEHAILDDDWNFEGAEVGFGGSDDAWPAYRLEVESPDGPFSLVLKGRIDRVDLAHDRTRSRVVDYKRSKKDHASLGKTDFQTLIYGALAAAVTGTEAAPGVYIAADGASAPSKKRFAEATDTMLDRLQAALKGPLAGVIAPTPLVATDCEHCDMRGACRKPAMLVVSDEVEDS